MALLGVDIYEIQEYINDLKKQCIDADEDTLAMGIFGYLGDAFSHMAQNNIIVSSEYINEMFPTRVKYERNIIDHAMFNNISEINATPATIQVILCLLEKDVEANLDDNNKFTIERNQSFFLGEYEFHLEYDVVLTKSILQNNSIMYTAYYNDSRKNPISTLSSTYLTTPYRQTENGYQYIFVTCQLRQVNYIESYSKIITSNSIMNKTLEFEFDNQLAAFDIKVVRGSSTYYITPIMEGSSTTNVSDLYCRYQYIDSTHIRVSFDSDSFTLKLNDEVTIYIQTTLGSSGNFSYVDDVVTTISSEDGSYSNISTLIRPLSDSLYGEDKLSIDELKKIIPREALSRGSLTTSTDLYNYFNTISTENNNMKFLKKSDNQFERLFYSYLLMKDDEGGIIPTNTIPIKLKYRTSTSTTDHDFDAIKDGRCIISPGTHFKFTKSNNVWTGHRVNPGDPYYFENSDISISSENSFVYSSPFLIIVNTSPLLYTSYYLNIINKQYQLLTNSDYVNRSYSDLQMIALRCNWDRAYKTTKYSLVYQCSQNINEDKGFIQVDEDGNPIKDDEGHYVGRTIRSILVLEGPSSNYFVEGELTNYSADDGFVYEFEFELTTEDNINTSNRIEINDIYEAQSEPPIDITIKDVKHYDYIPNASGTYTKVSSDDASCTWSRTSSSETYLMKYTSTTLVSGWEAKLTRTLNSSEFILNNASECIADPTKILKVDAISAISSINLSNGVGEYDPIIGASGIYSWQRTVDNEIYTANYNTSTTTWTIDVLAVLTLEKATISEIMDDTTFKTEITIVNVFKISDSDSAEHMYGRVSDDSVETVWNYNAGTYKYIATHYKADNTWSLFEEDGISMTIAASDIIANTEPITVTSAFNESTGVYNTAATGAYYLLSDTATTKTWKKSLGTDVYRIIYDKLAVVSNWSLVGPTSETYDFEFTQHETSSIIVNDVKDTLAATISDALGVYDLKTTASSTIRKWRMKSISGKVYEITYTASTGSYTIAGYIDFDTFSVDQKVSAFFDDVTPMRVYTMYKDSTWAGTGDTLTAELNNLVPDSYPTPLTDYVVCNRYDISGEGDGAQFFMNYTDIITSKASVSREAYTGGYTQYITLGSVPMIRAAYLDETSTRPTDIADVLDTKRGYIANALKNIEDQLGLDFKFYNTYGPSKIFYIDSELLSRVDISLAFQVGYKSSADKSAGAIKIKNDIKAYIEDLNNAESDLHMSNLITSITTDYNKDTITYIEFVSINGLSTDKQYLVRLGDDYIDIDTPPEFINIHYKYTLEDGKMVYNGTDITL